MLRRAMMVILLAGCGTSSPAPEAIGVPLAENPDIIGGLGSACRSGADCGDPDLRCDARLPGGLCTAACDDVPEDPDAEVAQCLAEPAATCLSGQPEETGLCTLSCEASDECLANQACTGLWWTRLPTPDSKGCLPFCHDDVPCAPHRECFTRMGVCATFDATTGETGKMDGEPCSVRDRNDAGYSAECRGDCFYIEDPADDAGLCGSFIDYSITQQCPDRPDVTRPLGIRGDDVALCAFRDCESDDECTAPLVCGACPDRGKCCVYP